MSGYRSRGGGGGRGQRGRDFDLPFRKGPSRGQSSSGSTDGTVVFTPEYPAVRDDNVVKKEDSRIASIKPTQAEDLPCRPGYGTQGRNVLLWANYFRLTVDSKKSVFRYSVALTPKQGTREVTGKLARRIIEILIEDNLKSFDAVSDFRSTILTRREITPNPPPDGYEIVYRSEQEDEPDPNAPRYIARLRDSGSLSLAALFDHTTSTNASALLGTRQELIQALNIIVGNQSKNHGKSLMVRKNVYTSASADGADRRSLVGGLEAMRAFAFSVRAATERLLVNVQVKNLPFYESGPLQGVVEAFRRENGHSPGTLANFLKKLSIELTHIRRVNKSGKRIPRYKTITGLATVADGRSLPSPPRVLTYGAGPKDVQFWLGDNPSSSSVPGSDQPQPGKGKGKDKKAGPAKGKGAYISVYEFFRRQYQITIKDTGHPVVNVGSIENPSYLPLQVCEVRPGQLARGKIGPRQTQDVIRFAVRKPALNAQSISTTGLRVLGVQANTTTLDGYGMSLDTRMITVPGRVLNPPNVKYFDNKSAKLSFGSWNLSSDRLSRPKKLTNWRFLIILNAGKSSALADEHIASELQFKSFLRRGFMKTLDQISGSPATTDCLGGRIIEVKPNETSPIDSVLGEFARDNTKLLLVVLPSKDATWIYNRVKYRCDVVEGLLNVCVVDTKFVKGNDQYFANVGLKINLKLGGCNHAVKPIDFGPVSPKETMFVGIDVTHPSPGSQSTAPSIAGIVASIDEEMAQWPADLRIQQARQEMVDSLDELLEGCLVRWQRKSKKYPANIVVYRDGVSEGQYQSVLDNELPALKKCIARTYPAPDTKKNHPRLTIIVVGKRHHTRFYATTDKAADRSGNPQNGTVVDRGVTDAGNWDFFLQAHTAIQGTARPAHYYVVWDRLFCNLPKHTLLGGNAADALEKMTHNMCYLFGRATKAVSVCPPAYYADLVCERARCYLAHYFDPTPPTSSAVSVASGSAAGPAPDAAKVRIHERVRDAMFYI